MKEIEFEIDREDVKHHRLAASLLGCLGCFVFLAVCFSPVILISLGIIGPSGRTLSRPTFGTAPLFWMFAFCIATHGFVFVFGQWLFQQQANNLRYRLDGSTLRVDGGVFFLFRKSIPLERITDVALVQGPLLRYCGIWAMQIQTAGTPTAEAVLYGVRDPEAVRDLILSRRQSVYGEKTGPQSEPPSEPQS